VGRGGKRESKKLTINSVGKAGPAVNGLRGTVVVAYLDRHSSYSSTLTKAPEFDQRDRTQTLVARPWSDIKIIQASHEPTVFHRIPEGDYKVANSILQFLDQPHISKPFVVKDHTEGARGSLTIKVKPGFFVELSHQPNQHRDVTRICSSHTLGGDRIARNHLQTVK
jgi:hypothetical protein